MALAGTYNCTVNAGPMGKQNATVTLADDGSGRLASMGVDSELQGVEVDGDTVNGYIEDKFPGLGQAKVALKVTVTGDDLAGSFKLGPMDFTITGTRA